MVKRRDLVIGTLAAVVFGAVPPLRSGREAPAGCGTTVQPQGTDANADREGSDDEMNEGAAERTVPMADIIVNAQEFQPVTLQHAYAMPPSPLINKGSMQIGTGAPTVAAPPTKSTSEPSTMVSAMVTVAPTAPTTMAVDRLFTASRLNPQMPMIKDGGESDDDDIGQHLGASRSPPAPGYATATGMMPHTDPPCGDGLFGTMTGGIFEYSPTRDADMTGVSGGTDAQETATYDGHSVRVKHHIQPPPVVTTWIKTEVGVPSPAWNPLVGTKDEPMPDATAIGGGAGAVIKDGHDTKKRQHSEHHHHRSEHHHHHPDGHRAHPVVTAATSASAAVPVSTKPYVDMLMLGAKSRHCSVCGVVGHDRRHHTEVGDRAVVAGVQLRDLGSQQLYEMIGATRVPSLPGGDLVFFDLHDVVKGLREVDLDDIDLTDNRISVLAHGIKHVADTFSAPNMFKSCPGDKCVPSYARRHGDFQEAVALFVKAHEFLGFTIEQQLQFGPLLHYCAHDQKLVFDVLYATVAQGWVEPKFARQGILLLCGTKGMESVPEDIRRALGHTNVNVAANAVQRAFHHVPCTPHNEALNTLLHHERDCDDLFCDRRVAMYKTLQMPPNHFFHEGVTPYEAEHTIRDPANWPQVVAAVGKQASGSNETPTQFQARVDKYATMTAQAVREAAADAAFEAVTNGMRRLLTDRNKQKRKLNGGK